jgi:hypothetical protein
MSRFYFDYVDGRYIEDREGEDHPDDTAALDAARQVASELARNRAAVPDARIVLKNERGLVIAEVPLKPDANTAH